MPSRCRCAAAAAGSAPRRPLAHARDDGAPGRRQQRIAGVDGVDADRRFVDVNLDAFALQQGAETAKLRVDLAQVACAWVAPGGSVFRGQRLAGAM